MIIRGTLDTTESAAFNRGDEEKWRKSRMIKKLYIKLSSLEVYYTPLK